MSDAASHADAQPGLAHHFESYAQQKESAFLGMWLFLVQEVMFFGGLFVTYAVYRSLYGEAFALASQELSVPIGAANTVVLLCSSFTMVWAVLSAQKGNNRGIVWGLILTIVFGLIFIGVKIQWEYLPKYEHHLIPGPSFEYHPKGGDAHGAAAVDHGAVVAPATAGASTVEAGTGRGFPNSHQSDRGIEIFFALYFTMTGMHALHMVVGIGIMLWMIPMAAKGKWTPDNHNFVEGFGLYWHFVDIVWIFIFPFLYLIGLAGG